MKDNKIKGKVCWFEWKDIRRIEPNYVFDEFNVLELHDILEEQMLEEGFVLYDEDIVFYEEVVVNGWHEILFNCIKLKGIRRNGKFILNSVGMQYKHIK
jgi:hypothetical protein